MYFSGNRYLTIQEMEVNARYIFGFLTVKGWTSNAIAGILGNMQTESTINPAIWQSLKQNNLSGGFGVVQWTPATKYLDWAEANNLTPSAMDSNLKRLLYEVENNIQWGNDSLGNPPPLNFYQFTKSSLSPSALGMMFLRHYERPLIYNQPKRGEQAQTWYNFLIIGSKPHFPTTPGLPITSPYGWRIDPIDGLYKHHNAIDIGGGGVEHPIYATQSGIIIRNTFTDYGGYTLRIKHTGDPYFSQYQHLKSAPLLNVGDVVVKGQTIATMGSTGDSTGIHLDFQIATSATGFHTIEGTIDPEIYLQTGGGRPGEGYIPKKTKFKPWLYNRKRRIIFK